MNDAIFGNRREILRARDDEFASGARFRRFKHARKHAPEPKPEANVGATKANQSAREPEDDLSARIGAEDWMDAVRAQTADIAGQHVISRRSVPAIPKRAQPAPTPPAPARATPMTLEHPVHVPGPPLRDLDGFDEPDIEEIRRDDPPPPSRQASGHKPVHHEQIDDIWKELPIVRSNLGPELLGEAQGVVSSLRNDPAARAFDLLRTRLVHTLKINKWHNVAVASPTPGCGSTFAAVNLALSLSRVPHSRTVLMDLNQRDPGIADLIGVRGNVDTHNFLRGQVSSGDYFRRLSKRLAVGLTYFPYPDASDLLHNPICKQALERMHEDLSPDVVVYDLPPILAQDDLAAFLPYLDGVLLIADGTKTTARHISECERILRGHTELLGVVLNKARKSEVSANAA